MANSERWFARPEHQQPLVAALVALVIRGSDSVDRGRRTLESLEILRWFVSNTLIRITDHGHLGRLLVIIFTAVQRVSLISDAGPCASEDLEFAPLVRRWTTIGKPCYLDERPSRTRFKLRG